MKRYVKTAAALLFLAALGGATVVLGGLVPIKASSGHWPVTEWFLHFAMKRAVSTQSMGVKKPNLDDDRLLLIGAGHYESGCRFCHGVPGGPLPVIPHHETPHPPNLKHAATDYDAEELFFIVKHGIKFTGMPAWPAAGREDEVWAVVSFLQALPEMNDAEYARLVFGEPKPKQWQQDQVPELVVERCARCHGAYGEGRDHAFPRLAGQKHAYLHASLQAYKRGERYSGIMQPIASELTEQEIDTAATWFAGQLDNPARPETDADRTATEAGHILKPLTDVRTLTQVNPLAAKGRLIALHGQATRRVPACAQCHGPAAHRQHELYPTLQGQPAAYLYQQLLLFSQEQRGGTPFAEVMRVVTDHTLEPDEMAAVATFYGRGPAQAAP